MKKERIEEGKKEIKRKNKGGQRKDINKKGRKARQQVQEINGRLGKEKKARNIQK